MTKPIRKFETQRQQRDEMLAIYDAHHGRGAAEKLFQQKLGNRKTVMKAQIALLGEFVDFSKPLPAHSAVSNAARVSQSMTRDPARPKTQSLGKTITRAAFDALSPKQRTEFCCSGGRLTD